MYYKDDGDACEDDTRSVRGRRLGGRRARRMIVLIREVQCRRIGLGRCKKMGRGGGYGNQRWERILPPQSD